MNKKFYLRESKRLEDNVKIMSANEKGNAPWVYWESENSSYGKLIRYFSYYSSYLPLFVKSDHAIHTESKLWQNEVNTKNNIPFLTWNYRKYLKFKKIKKNTYYILNPWSFYVSQKFNFLKKKNHKKGTIIIYPHSNSTTVPILNNKNYFDKLKKLPKRFMPLKIMLSYYDIEQNIHKKLLKYGIPIVTAGSIRSKYFVDKYINIISKFEYATSPKYTIGLGSAFFYCIDFGLRFFFYGHAKFRMIKEAQGISKKILQSSDFLDRNDKNFVIKMNKIFSYKNLQKIYNQKKFITKYMGYNSQLTRTNLFFILIKSLVLNCKSIPALYYNFLIKNFARKLFFLNSNDTKTNNK
jgi:hypothetical protein